MIWRKLCQWGCEIRDAHKIARIRCLNYRTGPDNHWRFLVTLPYLDIWLDHTDGCKWWDIDWSWFFLRWSIGIWELTLGLEDSD